MPTFLCRILARHDLASRLKLFIGTACNQEVHEQDVSSLSEDDWTRVRAAARVASINEAQGTLWIEAVEAGMWDALAALFLCVTPNLEEVKLHEWDDYSEDDMPFINAMLVRTADLQNQVELSPYSLSNLTSVLLTYIDTESGMGFDALELFLKLRSIAKFEASAVNEENGVDESTQPLPSYFRTKDVAPKDTVMDHADMAH